MLYMLIYFNILILKMSYHNDEFYFLHFTYKSCDTVKEGCDSSECSCKECNWIFWPCYFTLDIISCPFRSVCHVCKKVKKSKISIKTTDNVVDKQPA